MVTDEGYLLHTPPGKNNFFETDAEGWWTGNFLPNRPENRSRALQYNQIMVQTVTKGLLDYIT